LSNKGVVRPSAVLGNKDFLLSVGSSIGLLDLSFHPLRNPGGDKHMSTHNCAASQLQRNITKGRR